MSGGEFRRDGMGYVYEPTGLGVRIAVDYLHRRSDELTGELLIESTMPGVPPHLHQARLNMTSTTARKTLATHLSSITQGVVAWPKLIEAVCVATLRHEREGTAFEEIGQMISKDDPPDLIDRFLPSETVSSIYGPGGAGKGWLAMFAAVCVRTGTPFAGRAVRPGQVLYLDWEDTADRADRRVKLVSAGLGIDPPRIQYRRCTQPLRDMVHSVARYVAEKDIALIIMDSVEAGSHATSENASYQARAEIYFESIRFIVGCVPQPVTVLLIDHVSEEGRRNGRTVNKAINSVMKGNWVRSAWEVREQEAGGKKSHLGLYHFKANHSEKYEPLGLRLDFSTPGMVYLDSEAIRVQPDAEPQGQRAADVIAGLLYEHPSGLSAPKIAELTDLPDNTVRSALNRFPERFHKTDKGQWHLDWPK